MKRFLIAIIMCCLALGVSPAEDAKKPNILVIYTDDQSYRTVGCYPEAWPWVKTPHIDALAKSGIRFHGAYLGAWCTPSRASFLTGRQPHGILTLRSEGPYPGGTYDPKKCPFWPAQFRQQGYHTAQIGKWHTGNDTGFGRDWDHQIVWNRPKNPKNAGAYYDKQILEIDGTEKEVEGYPADNYTNWAVDYIRGQHREKCKPWFLWLCHGSVHGPSKPAARHKGLYRDAVVPEPADIFGPRPGKPEYLANTQAWTKDTDGKIVAASNGEKIGDQAGTKKTPFADWVRQVNECVPAIDEGVGEIIKALKESGQLDNTIVIFTADQGFAMGEHGMRMKIAPYDANYRSPLIIRVPSLASAGSFCPFTPNAPDLIATLHKLAGIELPRAMHGREFTPLLKDPSQPWTYPVLYEFTGDRFGENVEALLKQDAKKAHYQKVPWYTAVVEGNWKYVRYLQPGVGEELYDLKTDPSELKNLVSEPAHAARLQALRGSLRAELKRTEAPAVLLPTE